MAKARIPEGYKDEDEFLKEARERFQQGVDFDRENRDEAVEDLKFLAGEQWDEEAKALRNGRPMLTINTLPQYVAQVVGDMRVNKPAIRIRPAEDADKDLADVREGLMRAIERASGAAGIYANVGQNQTACGIGNFRITVEYATDSGFERDIRIKDIPNALAVVWDPLSTERTGRDAEWCFVPDMLPRKQFKRRWKDALPSSLEVPLHDVQGWYTQDTVRVTEYHILCEGKATYARLENGSDVEVKLVAPGQYVQLKRRKTVKELPLTVPIQLDDETGEPMIREGIRRYAMMYLITGDAILSGPHELPIDRVPIIRAQGWVINVGDKRVRFGLVRFARDPQRLKNYWRSISAEMLALAPKGKWLLHESQDGDQEAFREAHAADDPVLTYSGAVKPEYVPPPTLNSAVLQESALNTQDMKDVTGLHDASLGARSNETSGKAIRERKEEGDVATFIYPDNLQASIQEGGRIANQLVDLVFDTARTIRVVGEDDKVKVQRINDPNDPNSIDIGRGSYDVSVETGPSYSTKRAEASESMMAFVQAVPAAAQVSGDLIAQAQDWPMADKIAERLKRALPPQLGQDSDEELTPEQQQQRQQAAQAAQAQQAQQAQAAQLAMDEQQAKVAKLRADAMLTEAQARKMDRPEPDQQQEHPLDLQLKQEQVRKAQFDAERSHWEAELARLQLPASAGMAEAKTERERVALASDIQDLRRKPYEALHTAADLDNKINPPEPPTPAKA